jgi:hypothetical protein
MATFSFESGKPVAVIYGGVSNGKILYVRDNEEAGSYENQVDQVVYNVSHDRSGTQIIPDKFGDVLYNALVTKEAPNPPKLKLLYQRCLSQLVANNIQSFELAEDEFIQPLPIDSDCMNDRIYVAGPSGCGKSTWIGLFCIEYHQVNPDNKIYLFSRKNKDSALDEVEEIERINLDMPPTPLDEINAKRSKVKNRGKQTLVEKKPDDLGSVSDGVKIEEISSDVESNTDKPDEVEDLEPLTLMNIMDENKLEIFQESLVIFDDTDSLPEESRKIVSQIRDDLLETGRESRISVVVTSHILANYYNTRTIINESTGVVFFPKKGAQEQIIAFLKNRLNLSKAQIVDVMNLGKRWIYIYKDCPRFILHEHGGLLI